MAHAAGFDLYRLLADTTYDWETWVDGEGVARWVNPAVERITGYTVADCLALRDYPLPIAHQDDRALLSRVLADAAHGGSGNDVEFRIVHRAGATRWVAISWQAVRTGDGTRMGYRTSVRDIDDRKRMEQELHEMRRRAEAAAIARAELLANVSHELRSPAHCIAGFAELLLESELSAPQHRQVELIVDQCATMMRQVEDLLELAAIEAGGVRLSNQSFDLHALLSELVEAAQLQATVRGLLLRADTGSISHWVEGDPHRLRQVLRNLLDNALKFTEQGRVSLTVRRELESDRVLFVLEDTGVGMAQHDIARLLEPFQQGDASTTRRQGGAGLGLAICRRLVHAMAGELHIASELARGTRVEVRLSLPVTQPNVEAVSARVPSLSPGHALVVDDSAPARELLRGMLERLGWTASEAASGRSALALATRGEFDAVLLDYQMPDSDGAETSIALRRLFSAHKPERRIPIFLLTANVFVRDQLSAAREAIDAIVQKPLSRHALEELLRTTAPLPPGPLDRAVVLDLVSTLARDGQTMFARLLPRVLERLSQSFAALEQALARRAHDEAARQAHAIAGEAAMIGARVLADAARSLETGLTTHELSAPALERALAQLNSAREQAEAALVELRE
jgi:PAS domain S-box-containing protein